MSVTSGYLNATRTLTHHGFVDHINPTAQSRVYDEPLPSTEGLGGTMPPSALTDLPST